MTLLDRYRYHRPHTVRHVLLIVVMLAVAAVAWLVLFKVSANTTYQNSAQLYQSTFKINSPHPFYGAPALPLRPTLPETAAAGHIAYKDLQHAVTQGSVGQCTCEAFRYMIDYLVKRRIGVNPNVSCRFLYSYITGGHDAGTNGWQYPPIVAQIGYVLNKQYGYRGQPTDDQLQYPLPNSLIVTAAHHRYGLHIHVISADANGGQPAITGIEKELHAGRPVMAGFPVWWAGQGQNSIFDVTPWAPYIDIPGSPQQTPAGFHTVTITGYDRNKCITTNAGKTCGVFTFINSWSGDWGVDFMGRASQDNAGFGYMTYRFVAKYGSELLSYRLGRANPTAQYRATAAPPFDQPGPIDRGVPAPPLPPGYRVPPFLATQRLWVTGVFAKDTGRRLDTYINDAAAKEHISPVGLLATIGAECGLYTNSPTCDHVWSATDDSFGCCQITVQTAAQFGVGNGVFDGYYGPNVTYVRNYENNAANGIKLAAMVLGSYAHYENTNNCPQAADFPHLYVAWNAGPAQPCWFLLTPTGQAGSNYYSNFLGWMSWAYQYATVRNPAKIAPNPFNTALWCSWATKRHRPCISHRYHGHLSWAASVWRHHQHLGGIKRAGYYGNANGYTKTVFAHGAIFTWPAYHKAKVVA